MKKTISLAMAAALAVSGAVTTVPVFADDVTNITIWSPTDKESIEAWWKERISEWNEEHPEIQVSREQLTVQTLTRMITRLLQQLHPTIFRISSM